MKKRASENKEKKRIFGFEPSGAFWCSAAVLAVFVPLSVFAFIYQLINGFVCIFRELTGIPCPGCGMTRAYLSLLRLDLASAFFYHPMFWSVPLIVSFGALAAFSARGRKITLTLFAVLVLALLICWAVRLITGTAV